MERLQAALQSCGYSYELIKHEALIHSAQDGANYFGIHIGQTAPTLVIKTEKGFYGLIVSGNRGKVDFDEISKGLGCQQAKLASAKEVQQITGFSVGSVSMVCLSIPCIIDEQLDDYDFIYGGTGDPAYTLKIEPQALRELNQVVWTFG